MSDEAAIVPAREQAVEFYGDTVPAAQLADGTVLVPLRPICEALGLNWSGQLQRTQRDEVLGDELSVCVIHTEPGPRPMQCLPLKHLPGWLFGISARRVRPELQDKILRYRRECFDVLWRAFAGEILPAAPAPVAASAAEMALQLARAVASLAQQQVEFEQRYTQMADYMRGHVQHTNLRLRGHDDRLDEHETRLAAIEIQLSGGATISEAQAAELALAVKSVGSRLAAQGDRNGYQRVYAELYRRYGISSYKALPSARYQHALDWLHNWFTELSDAAPS